MEKILIAEDRYGLKSSHLEDDDIIDRLNNRVTVLGLIMCVFIIGGGVLVGKPINCWTPAEFKGQHDGYANSICWLKGSYYLPTDEITIPDRSKPRSYFVSYYQWTAFILLGMAMFFLLPRYLWQAFTRQSGFNIKKVIKNIKEQKEANKGVESAQKLLKTYLDALNESNGSICCGVSCPNFHVGYITAYLAIKVLYIINSITQFFLLNTFLAFNFTSFGPEGINKLLTEGDWFESPRFPRVTMCDFMVRRLGSNQHWYSVQCNLPINMFNEKIFLAIWLWLIILTILNFLSIFPWIVFLSKQQRSSMIHRYLQTNSKFMEETKDLLSLQSASTYRTTDSWYKTNQFIDYLQVDGFLIFYIIAINTDDVTASEIIGFLYGSFTPSPSRFTTSEV
ncbi:unnamed protein product [Rotaria socialis]|uniref:Innexin n=1 Tax=Rotaria socialis TaxID=392032 RepID=A0A818TXJ7_9BILA|nr:unnamed protein product [Rotaria socialis]CAF3518707.1 unnamed protein product [Rotaria socialis]CAF3655329.1 unnamed protein product [Rotaria socialis]CAF3690364.1 unnamed protein product [Rotaria socialis]CAF3727691.1 unnamed protein product [Rotaria socialis]